ncbi:MAG: class I SAM-dependent methyltransferase [Candidatus Zixiibacteriota bacterium]|nr:MAG: class I SAM-dependent methyltransferase [candidate division Zixibacteria bacterium]
MIRSRRKVGNYTRLCRYYDAEWATFSKQYVDLCSHLLAERGIRQARILDLACGTGNLAIMLADKGHIVHGIDNSSEMIEIARHKAVGMPNVKFELRDMRRFESADRFDLVTCAFDSINYIRETSDLKHMLTRVAKTLQKDGLFAFDSNTERLYARYHDEVHERNIDGDMFFQKTYYEPDKKLARTVFEFADGAVEEHLQRPYDLPELEPCLAAAGLRVIHAFSRFDRSPFTFESGRLICIAGRV